MHLCTYVAPPDRVADLRLDVAEPAEHGGVAQLGGLMPYHITMRCFHNLKYIS